MTAPTRRLSDGTRIELTEQDQADLAASLAPSLADVKQAVVDMMARLQDGGITYGGVPFGTDERAKSDMLGAAALPRESRRIVPRAGGGQRLTADADTCADILEAVEDYRQAVMDHAADLLDALDGAGDFTTVDINAGWPSNVYSIS